MLAALAARSVAATSAAHRIGSAPRLPHGARVTGRLRSGRSLSLVVALKPSDPLALAAYATAVSTPGLAEYRQYLSVAQFRQRFAPSDEQIQAVRSELRSAGLAPGSVSANGLLIDVTASAGRIASALHTSFSQVHLASGRTAYANTAAPELSGSVAGLVQGVIGLDNLSVPHALGLERGTDSMQPFALTAPRASAVSANISAPTPSCTGATTAAGDYGAYTANEIASAYGFTSLYGDGDFGAGQTVALIEFAPYRTTDLNVYQSCYGTPSETVTSASVDGGAGTDTSGVGTAEADLDIEQIMGLTPAADIKVYEAPDNDTGPLDDLTQIVDDDTAQVVSTSWGSCELDDGMSSEAAAENTLFEEAAAQGQSVYAAAGDSGSTDCDGDGDGSGNDGALAVDDPGSQPYVTSVGGTTLRSATASTQTVWNESQKEYGATGGGLSGLWAMPSYQSEASSSLNVIKSGLSERGCGSTGTSYCREVPDVSADADPVTGYVVYTIDNLDSNQPVKYGWTALGGTSAAAPLWAALTALANASSYCAGTPIGFANPVLYDVADNDYGSAFTDITSAGNNDYAASGYSGDLYPVESGYDMATGLGTPIAGTLVPDMCAAPRSTTTSFPVMATTTNTTATPLGPTCKAATNTLRKSGDNLALRNHRRSAKLTLSATVASNCSSDKLSFQIHIATSESKHTRANDTVKVRILSTSGKTLATLKTLSNHNAARGYKTVTLRVEKWVGKKVKVEFLAGEGGHKSTSFTVREVKLAAS